MTPLYTAGVEPRIVLMVEADRPGGRSGRISCRLLTRAVNESGMFTTKPEMPHMSLTTKCTRDGPVVNC